MEMEREYRLLLDWGLLEEQITEFLKDPLKWVADRLRYVHDNRDNVNRRQKNWEEIEKLIGILRFLNEHKYLIVK